MIIEGKNEFTPITITIESIDEVCMFREIMNNYADDLSDEGYNVAMKIDKYLRDV